MTIVEIKSLVDANVDLFHAAIVCFDCVESYDEFSKQDECQQCGNRYAPTDENQNCPECNSPHYDSLCKKCGSTDVIALIEVLDSWDEYVDEHNMGELRQKIEKFVEGEIEKHAITESIS